MGYRFIMAVGMQGHFDHRESFADFHQAPFRQQVGGAGAIQKI